MRHGTCFRRRLSTHHAGAAPHSAVAELGVVRRFDASMKIVGTYSTADAEMPQNALSANAISFESSLVITDFGTEEIHLSVLEADFERAADILEQLDADINSTIDLCELSRCPRCGSSIAAWHQHEGPNAPTELLFCNCSGQQPVAFRDPDTKRGGLFEFSDA